MPQRTCEKPKVPIAKQSRILDFPVKLSSREIGTTTFWNRAGWSFQRSAYSKRQINLLNAFRWIRYRRFIHKETNRQSFKMGNPPSPRRKTAPSARSRQGGRYFRGYRKWYRYF